MADEKKKTPRRRAPKDTSTPPAAKRADVTQPLIERLKSPRSITGIGRVVLLAIAMLADGRVTQTEYERLVDAAATAMKSFGPKDAKRRREAREEDDLERAVGRRAHELAAERTGSRRRDDEFRDEARKQVLAERAKAAAAAPTA